MYEPTTAWDRGPTDAELIQFYGDEPTPFDTATAIERHIEAIDADDLCQVVQEQFAAIKAAILADKPADLLAIFATGVCETVARNASIAVYGNADAIKPDGVTL